MRLDRHWKAAVLLSGACLAGCGGESTAPGESAGSSAAPATQVSESSEAAAANVPPTASITAPAEPDAEPAIVRPDQGTPEWLILQITQLKVQSLPETDDVNVLRKARQDRNQKIIEIATEVIAKTHKTPEKELVFNSAVHHLLDATMQLAMAGDNDSVDALYEHADVFYQRDPKSRAASEASFFLARFANENAARSADKDVRWLQEFARQARLFAERFPQEQHRSASLLNDAATSCDYWGLAEEAVQCYSTIRQKFPETPQADQVVAPLRRLALTGKPVDLGGPTSDGGFTSIADFKGSPVLVVFWSTEARPFVDQAKEIIETVGKYEAQGLQVLGVNLDTDESAVDAFADKTGINWRTIFHVDATKRGWNHPVVVYYGVRGIPQFWLVGRDGNVVTTTLQAKDLDRTLSRVMATSATPAATTTPARPAPTSSSTANAPQK